MHPSFEFINHRPWPLPEKPWRGRQTWTDLAFIHYEITEADLRPYIPDELEIDTFDGAAWIGLVPFDMKGIAFRGLPKVPGLSHFPEINVRTYVIRDGKPGVWFLSLDVPNPVAVWGARKFFHLPYHRADIRLTVDGTQTSYYAKRDTRLFDGTYSGGSFIDPPADSFERWASERYCLYSQDTTGRLYRGQIHHKTWPLQSATLHLNEQTYLHNLNIKDRHPVILFSKSIDVAIWFLEQI